MAIFQTGKDGGKVLNEVLNGGHTSCAWGTKPTGDGTGRLGPAYEASRHWKHNPAIMHPNPWRSLHSPGGL